MLKALTDLLHASVATDAEVLHFMERHALSGCGIGNIDAHLLAAVKLTPGAELWTSDKGLHGIAGQLGSAITLPRSRRS